MKKVVLYTKFIISLLLLGAPLQGATATTDADRILKALDNICGDAWCEGAAFDYHFQKVLLKPAQNETQILFRLSQEYPVRLDWSEGQTFQAQINRRFYDVSCVIPGYASYDSIMQSESRLHKEVFAAFTQCVESLEVRLMQVTKPL